MRRASHLDFALFQTTNNSDDNKLTRLALQRKPHAWFFPSCAVYINSLSGLPRHSNYSVRGGFGELAVRLKGFTYTVRLKLDIDNSTGTIPYLL